MSEKAKSMARDAGRGPDDDVVATWKGYPIHKSPPPGVGMGDACYWIDTARGRVRAECLYDLLDAMEDLENLEDETDE